MVMSAACLPGAIAIAMWERKENTEHQEKALRWFRGAIFAAGFPYLLIAHVPWLNVLAIWFVAWQSGLFLQWSGAGEIQLGETSVQYADGSTVEWSAWEGNRWFLTEEMSEYSFSTELLGADGTQIGISFVLACTAIQSMIIFVGAISVLEVSWKMKFRALLITLPLIHILNLFRNAGLIWLQSVYVDWRYLGLTIFEFGHAYASRVASLAAMFLLALVLFDMLPQMHRHVLTLLRPLGLSPGKR
jgi:exosortase/archaeosortase family protein